MQYILRRLILTIPVIIGATLIVFLILHLIPGDPVDVIFAGTGASLEQKEDFRHSMGLDLPLPVQYFRYLGNTLQGDFGQSIHYQRPVSELIFERLPATIELGLAGLLTGLIIALPAGIISSVKRHSFIDYLVMTFATLGISLPTFWVSILLIMLFSGNLGWLPSFGRIDLMVEMDRITGFYLIDSLINKNLPAFKDTLTHLILPATALGISAATLTARLVRSSMLEELNKDYVRAAQAKGLMDRKVLSHHVIRNALIPVITIIGGMIGDLLGGSVIVETIFAWPGIGRLAIQAISTRDYAVVQGAVLFFALIRIGVNLITDFLYVVIDPRIGHI